MSVNRLSVVTSLTFTSASTTLTTIGSFDATTFTQNDRALLICVQHQRGVNNLSLQELKVGAQSAALVAQQATGTGPTSPRTLFYVIANPTSTLEDVQVRFNAADSDIAASVNIIPLANVDTASVIGATAVFNTQTMTISVAIAPQNAGSTLFGMYSGTTSARDGFTPGAGVTELLDTVVMAPTNGGAPVFIGEKPLTTADATTFDFTQDTYQDTNATVVVEVNQATTPTTITNIDTDNAVNQYQQSAVIALSNTTESMTSVTLNAVACPIQSQVVGSSVTVDIPGSLATGTYDLVVSGATETATLTGVSYTQTHARPAFDGLVDSNSILSGQSYTANTYFRFVTSFSNGTLDTAAGDAAEWAGDIADYYTPNAGFTGDDTASIEFLYSDGTTSATVNVTVTVGTDEVAPTVTSVGVPTAGTYAPGQVLSFTVNWSEAVNVTGTPAINLDIGGSARQANYASGTGTSALVFSYTVQSGDLDTNGITVGTLTLDGGTIQDSAPNAAVLTLNSVGDTSGVLVDGVGPAITINGLTTTDTTPTASGSAGDAVSLTLDLVGVDVVHSSSYTITPAGGSWSQTFPELALGEYTMTLNGEDAVGNAAVQRTATLSVVEEIVSTGRRRGFRSAVRAAVRSGVTASVN